MKKWNLGIALILLVGLTAVSTARAEFFGAPMPVGGGFGRAMPMPGFAPGFAPRSCFSCGGGGSHGFAAPSMYQYGYGAYGGYRYAYYGYRSPWGYGYGYYGFMARGGCGSPFRRRWGGCGRGRRSFRSFSLSIRIGGFGLRIASRRWF